jgi:hypothetical protein
VAGFETRDRRSSALRAPEGSGRLVVARGSREVRQALASRDAVEALDRGRQGPAPTERLARLSPVVSRTAGLRAMGAVAPSSADTSIRFATQRSHDPMFYFRQNGIPYDVGDPEQLTKIREWCRFIYRSNPVLASAIDVFAKWPVTGAEFRCRDPKLVEFYEQLFFDQLDYEEYLVDLGREFWTVGEAWPLASWNETLGVWDADELLDPDNVEVEKSPFLADPQFLIRLPETLREVLRSGKPEWQYKALTRSYPELRGYLGEDDLMPVSDTLLKQLKFKGDGPFNPRGVPILLRALRAAIQEEMLNAAQDAIADRLYTPLILMRVGASAADLGTKLPWVPTQDELEEIQGALDAALAADFRIFTSHFATQIESVFGRETMPNFDADFERLTERQLQAFGLSKTMLSGGDAGETYAADAVNRDLVSQLLGSYQRYVRRFVRDRMLVVAEAQEHWDYEVVGKDRRPIMEEVLVVDEDGDERVEERHKLLVPDLDLQNMAMRDEMTRRQFLEALRASGVPVSMRTRLINVPIDIDEEIEASRDEQVQLAVEAQETRRQTYTELRDRGLPIPQDLRVDFEPVAQGAPTAGPVVPGMPSGDPRAPLLGVDGQGAGAALAPTPMDLATPPGIPTGMPTGPAGEVDLGMGPAGAGASVIALPTNRARPPESDEMRAGMPVAGSLQAGHDGAEPAVARTGALTEGPRHTRGVRRPQERPAGADRERAG